MLGKNGFIEEINPTDKELSYGLWQYTKKVDYSLIKPNKNLIATQKGIDIDKYKDKYAFCPVSPALPLVHKNIAFIGDSFGSSPSSACYGFGVVYDIVDMLTKAIKNDNLKIYEKLWKGKYLKPYMKYLIHKFDFYHISDFYRKIKGYPDDYTFIKSFNGHEDLYYKIFSDPTLSVKLPKKTSKLFSKRKIFFLIYNLIKIKFIFWKMDMLAKIRSILG
jgi:hypothetical protein